MSFSKSIFNKDLASLTINDLVEFFNQEQEETSTLEFKSDAELISIPREVCAFLNTEGGLLIIGAPEEKELGSKKRVCTGELKGCTKIKGEHSLLQTIGSNISPSPINLSIKEFDYKGKPVFVVEVPQSKIPPHQVNAEGKYYIRLDKDAKAAPHGIVEALFFKRQKPHLTIGITMKIVSRGLTVDDNKPYFEITCCFKNEGLVAAEKLGFEVSIYRVREVVSRQPNTPYSFSGHVFNLNVPYHEGVMVNGLSSIIKASVVALDKVLFVVCNTWSKDSEMVHCTAVLDTEKVIFESFHQRDYNSLDELNKDVDDYWNKIDPQKQSIIRIRKDNTF